MKVLTLALKGKWFNQVKLGEKGCEFRLVNDYWTKRLKGREYDKIVLTLGYPKKSDASRRLEFPWNGYTVAWVKSEEWNNEPQLCFCIKLDKS